MISAYLTELVTVVVPGGRDAWGSRTGDTSESARARVEYKTKLVRNERGEEVASHHQVLMEERTLTHEHRIVVDGVERAILSIGRAADFGTRYLRVYLD